jgi:hypothetical protein
LRNGSEGRTIAPPTKISNQLGVLLAKLNIAGKHARPSPGASVPKQTPGFLCVNVGEGLLIPPSDRGAAFFLVKPPMDALDIASSYAAIAGAVRCRERILAIRPPHVLAKPYSALVECAFVFCH